LQSNGTTTPCLVTGAAALMNCLPEAEWLLADRGYDADWFRTPL
jgi:hypothetical protein